MQFTQRGRIIIYIDGLKQGIDKIDDEIARKWDASLLKGF